MNLKNNPKRSDIISVLSGFTGDISIVERVRNPTNQINDLIVDTSRKHGIIVVLGACSMVQCYNDSKRVIEKIDEIGNF